MLTNMLIAVAVIVVLFVVVAAMQPADFCTTRSLKMAAPPEAAFAQVNDFHKWEAWSPWAKMDPAMKQNYEGAPAGPGAIYSWTGNGKVGAGRMTLTDSRPPEQLRIKLEFLKPFAATNTAEFTFQPDGGQTVVTWSMSGKKVFVTKAFGLFMNMDKMIGGQFEQGLASMKTVAETAAKAV